MAGTQQKGNFQPLPWLSGKGRCSCTSLRLCGSATVYEPMSASLAGLSLHWFQAKMTDTNSPDLHEIVQKNSGRLAFEPKRYMFADCFAPLAQLRVINKT
ncbi:hypothetical protein L3X38_028129 [Prunus dulcis]|uniref:Uncharacterized protein n=1 Tax=Prunus dulcis TaxID=3755 RepID=A0AAD4Z049_PRUDU|nr:hypothetical protein L3X38_028129 [Prunus dulcis]